VAFRKEAWAGAGGYPEWLDYCEDLVFDFCLLADAGQAVFAPAALVYFRPRPNLAAFGRQYYRYARGDGKADLWAGRHAIRYATYWAPAWRSRSEWPAGSLWPAALVAGSPPCAPAEPPPGEPVGPSLPMAGRRGRRSSGSPAMGQMLGYPGPGAALATSPTDLAPPSWAGRL
jgi:hypothetical protein